MTLLRQDFSALGGWVTGGAAGESLGAVIALTHEVSQVIGGPGATVTVISGIVAFAAAEAAGWRPAGGFI